MRKLIILLLSTTLLFSCSKEGDPGPMGPSGIQGPQGESGIQGPQGESGPGAIVYDFDLSFGPEDTFNNFNGMMDDYLETDVAMVYIRNEYGWVPLPYYWVGEGDYIDINIYPEIADDGKIWINTIRADGETGSPWNETVTIEFRAVLIMSEFIVYKDSQQTPPYEVLKSQLNLVD